jgi:two-component system LytT family response regulator
MLIADVNYTNFIMVDGNTHLVSHSLRYFEPFMEIYGFLRIRRGSMINPAFIKEFCPVTSAVTMRNGMSVKVARRKKEAFLTAMNAQIPCLVLANTTNSSSLSQSSILKI